MADHETQLVRIVRTNPEEQICYGVGDRVEITGHPGHYVDPAGRIWSCRPANGRGPMVGLSCAREIKPRATPNGYRIVSLTGGKDFAVHVIVCTEFHGPCPEGHEVRHRDGVRHHNEARNVAWATHVENCADRKAHGTHYEGYNHPQSKMTPALVAEIRAAYVPYTMSAQKLADQFGLSRALVDQAIRGKKYA